MDDGVGVVDVREVVRATCDFDPGPLAPTDRLADVGLSGLDLLTCVAALEDRFGVEFPADLVPALETVDDLVYFTAIKQSQR
jgi:acyl carrier protein